ncbi:MAG: leucine-rich repeat domain-containing protein, partial [Verrucomicrobia bacterium]|nr:leucine-rich repeat domain-containing protein [Verrucomicrobiota bacterium]
IPFLPTDTITTIVFCASESQERTDITTICAARGVNHSWKIAVDSRVLEKFWQIAVSENSLFHLCIPNLNPSDIEKVSTATFIKGFYPSYNKIPKDEVPTLYWKLTCQDPAVRKDWEMRAGIKYACDSLEGQTNSIQSNPSCQIVLGSPVLLKFACLATELQSPRLGISPSEHSSDIALETMWKKVIEQSTHNKLELDGLELPVKASDIRLWLHNPDNAVLIRKMVHLNLSGLGLTQLPPEIGKFTGLQTLVLSNNKLTFLPESICNLTFLYNLYVEDNQLLSLPNSIGNLNSLHNIQVNNNQLHSLPHSITNLNQESTVNINNNPCLFMLDRKLSLKEHGPLLAAQVCSAWRKSAAYQCLSPLASLCQSIHLQVEQPFEAEHPLLDELFSQLPQEMQNQIKTNLGPAFQNNPCKNQGELAKAIISTLKTQFEALSDSQRKLVYYLVWDIAGQPPECGDNWAEYYGSQNVMLLIDAFAVAAAIGKYEALPEDQKKLVHYHNWNLAERPPGDNWGAVHLMDDKARFLKALSLATGTSF